MESTFSNEQRIALAKLISDKEFKAASANVSPGDHAVDFLLRVSGQFTKGADYDQRISAKADAWGLLALALSKLNGVTVESLVREWVGFAPENANEIKAQATKALGKIKADTYTSCTGKVSSVKLAVELVPVHEISETTQGQEGVA